MRLAKMLLGLVALLGVGAGMAPGDVNEASITLVVGCPSA